MITCTNCAHKNPDGATQCEACYTPLAQVASPPIPPTIVSSPDAKSSEVAGDMLPLPIGGDPASGALPMSPMARPVPPPVRPASTVSPKTQIQQLNARLLHVQSNSVLELPAHLSVVHIGKPNDRIPPDIDVSGFTDADIVSRIHADIRIEGDAYYIEDVGSSNGTYINNLPLYPGNRHRLRAGDRIALGKGDRVSFLFQIA